MQVKGKGAKKLFQNEAGMHRWQGISKNKTHSSMVTVAVLDEESAIRVQIDPKDVDITTTRGSGKGGQHRNVTDSCVVLHHRPSGIRVRIQSERSQGANKDAAFDILRARLLERTSMSAHKDRSDQRKSQIASGEKRRTVQEQNGQVIDHVTGKKCDLGSYLKGHIENLTK